MNQIMKAIKINNRWMIQATDWTRPLDNYSWRTRTEAYSGCKRLYPNGKRVHGGYSVPIEF